MPRKKNGGVEGHDPIADNGHHVSASAPPSDLTAIVDQIRYWHRQRCAAMEARKTIDLRLGAHLRIFFGWSRQLPDRERKAIAIRAAKMIKTGEGGQFSEFIAAFVLARKPFDKIEARCVKEMATLATSLPVWPSFGESIRGFGEPSLAVIVAEAGDLSNYATVAKLWKRMGLAVIGGVRQGGLAKNASAESWIVHGYNRQRRSRVWNIGDALIKGNKTGEYRAIYLARKKYELARDPEMKPIKAHRRAQRYMEKRLLRNLWRAWRRAVLHVNSADALPAASSSVDEAERRTTYGMLPTCSLSDALIPAKAGKRQANLHSQPNGVVPAAISSAVEAERSASGKSPPSGNVPSAPTPAKAGRRRAIPSMQSVSVLPAAPSSAVEAERSAESQLRPN